MQVNGVSQRYHVTGVVMGNAAHSTSTAVSITIASGGLVVGSAVDVVPAVDAPAGCIYTGRVVDATHIAVRANNITAGDLSLGTVALDIFVTPPTGEQTDVVIT